MFPFQSAATSRVTATPFRLKNRSEPESVPTSYDVFAPSPDLIRSKFFFPKTLIGKKCPMSYAKFQRDLLNGLAAF